MPQVFMTSQLKNVYNWHPAWAGLSWSSLSYFTSPVVNWKEMETTELTDSDSSPPKEHSLNIDISSSPLHKMKVYQQPLGAW